MVLLLSIIKLLYLINFCSYPSAPKLSIQMSDSNSGAALTAGQNYGIICSVLGAENLDSTITFRWMKMSQIQIPTHSLQLESLMLELIILVQLQLPLATS